jgi:hypothetical protein
MKTFIQRFGRDILGVLHGLDRIRFRGTRRFLANVYFTRLELAHPHRFGS